MSAPFGFKGKCLCGTVTIKATANTPDVAVCHCDMCRRWSAGPFMEVTCQNVIFDGEDSIGRYRSSDWAERGFCTKCGSNLFYHIIDSDEYQLSSGLFDDQSALKMYLQVYIDSKPGHYDFANKTKTMTEQEVIAAFVPQPE